MDLWTRFFHLNVLPFGLSSACYVFTKVSRPFVKRWRSNGIEAITYIGEGIVAFFTFELTKSAAHLVRSDLIITEFVINEDKSGFILKKVKWLGVWALSLIQ